MDDDDLSACAADFGRTDCSGSSVCRGHFEPDSDVDADPSDNCTTESEGDSCTTADDTCDPGLGCGVRLVCTDRDPTAGPGGCPRSRTRHKHQIRYVDEARRQELASALLSIPLAEYVYRHAPERAAELGFLIEDVEPSPAARGDPAEALVAGLPLVDLADEIERLGRRILADERHLVARQAQLAGQVGNVEIAAGPGQQVPVGHEDTHRLGWSVGSVVLPAGVGPVEDGRPATAAVLGALPVLTYAAALDLRPAHALDHALAGAVLEVLEELEVGARGRVQHHRVAEPVAPEPRWLAKRRSKRRVSPAWVGSVASSPQSR